MRVTYRKMELERAPRGLEVWTDDGELVATELTWTEAIELIDRMRARHAEDDRTAVAAP